MSIGNAVDLWTHLKSAGKDPLQVAKYRSRPASAVEVRQFKTGSSVSRTRVECSCRPVIGTTETSQLR